MSDCKRKNYNEFKYLIQKGTINKLKLIIAENTDFKKSQTALFKYLYVINKVTKHYVDYHFNRSSDNYDGCYINMEMLKKILGADNGQTIRIIQDLIEHKIIKRVGNYLKGNHSYKYILGDLSDKTFEYYTCIPKFERISHNIISKHNELNKIVNDDLLLYKDYLSRIKVNGIEYIYSHYNSYIHPMLADFEIDGLICGHTKEIDNLLIESLIAIDAGNIDIHRGDILSRVYTFITNLKRELRALLRYEGQGFIELDIRNSQPLIASILIKNYWQQKNMDIPEDVLRYIKDCENGIFYEYFMVKNNITEESRSDFKVMFFADLFFSRVKKRLNRLTQQFIEKYPNCYEAICSIKGGVGSGNYKFFSKSLQRTEAQLIFDDVNMGLLRRGIPAFNIFDSILCLPQDVEIVKEAILNAFRRHNLTPTLNTKDYTQSVSVESVMALIDKNRMIKLDKKLIKIRKRKLKRNNVIRNTEPCQNTFQFETKQVS